MSTMLEQQLALLRYQRTQGADVDGAIVDTLVAMVKDSYVRGDIEIDYLEFVVAGILRGEPVGFLSPGERVLRAPPADRSVGA